MTDRHITLRLHDHASLLRLMDKHANPRQTLESTARLLDDAAAEIERQSKEYVMAVAGRQDFRRAFADMKRRAEHQDDEVHHLQQRMKPIADQQRVLRLVAANIVQLLTEGGVGDREQLARLLDGCVEELGRLTGEAT